jgi:hypothetical protein
MLWIRVPSFPPFNKNVAQLVEQQSPKLRAEGSIPFVLAILDYPVRTQKPIP